MKKNPCPKCRHFIRGCIDEPCSTCHGWEKGSSAPNYQPIITQDAAYALLAVCEAFVTQHENDCSDGSWWWMDLADDAEQAIANAKGQPDA